MLLSWRALSAVAVLLVATSSPDGGRVRLAHAQDDGAVTPVVEPVEPPVGTPPVETPVETPAETPVETPAPTPTPAKPAKPSTPAAKDEEDEPDDAPVTGGDEGVASDSVAQFVSTSLPLCSEEVSQQLVTMYGKNRNLFEKCTAESHQYSIFPYRGVLPSNDQILSLVASDSCLYCFAGVLALPPELPECNLSGLDQRAAMETLLMTSQDLIKDVAPLTTAQLREFITWRHDRNVAKAARKPYDSTSASAVAFEQQLTDALARLAVTLSDDLVVIAGGQTVGSTVIEGASEKANEGSTEAGEVGADADADATKKDKSSAAATGGAVVVATVTVMAATLVLLL